MSRLQKAGTIPSGLDEVTPQWLTSALQETGRQGTIRGLEVDDVIHGTSSKIFLVLDRDEAAIRAGLPGRMCLKVNWEAHAPDTLRRSVWCTEGQFYRHMRQDLPAPAPAGYYGAYDETTGQGLVLMEDLRAAGARFGSNGEPLSADQAAGVLEDLASLHAAWWGSPKLESFDWLLASMAGPTFIDRYDGAEGLAVLTQPPERAATMSAAVNDPELWIRAVRRLVAREQESEAPRCLIHGDTHLGNSYLLHGEPLRWLDWQLVRKGRPPREVNYFLGCALDVPTRRASERDLIQHYLDCLASHGVEGAPGFDAFWADYVNWPIWGLLCWAVTGDGWQPTPVIHETMRRFATAIEDYECFKLL